MERFGIPKNYKEKNDRRVERLKKKERKRKHEKK